MRYIQLILIWALVTGAPLMVWGAENISTHETGVQAAAAHESHALTAKPVVLWHVAGLPITNSMVVTWIVALGLIVFAQFATRKMQAVPDGRAELLGMAGGEPVRVPGRHHRASNW